MKKFKFNFKEIFIVLILYVFAVLSIRFNSKPNLYMGYVFSLFIILIIGTYLNKIQSFIFSGLVVYIGFMARKYYPIVISPKIKNFNAINLELLNYSEFVDKYLLYLIVLGAFVGVLGSFIGENIRKERKNLFSVNSITQMSILIALSVIVNTLRVGDVSFGGFPIIMSGYFMGPIYGFIVGAVADVVGFIIRPSAFSFNIFFTFTSALTGFIPIFITKILGDNYPKFKFWKILIGIFIGQMLTSVIMVPLFQSFILTNTFYYYFIKAFTKQIISIPIYAVLIIPIVDRISKVINFKNN